MHRRRLPNVAVEVSEGDNTLWWSRRGLLRGLVLAPAFVDPQQRGTLISRAAYFRAMERGFTPGHELEDWLAAEAEVDAELLRGTGETAHT